MYNIRFLYRNYIDKNVLNQLHRVEKQTFLKHVLTLSPTVIMAFDIWGLPTARLPDALLLEDPS
jgi:hypothetical protein